MIYMKIALFLLFGAALSCLQIWRLKKQGEKNDIAAYSLLMLTALAVGSLLLADVRLPSPAVPLQAVFEPVGKWFFP